jgi:hypothetical protein
MRSRVSAARDVLLRLVGGERRSELRDPEAVARGGVIGVHDRHVVRVHHGLAFELEVPLVAVEPARRERVVARQALRLCEVELDADAGAVLVACSGPVSR